MYRFYNSYNFESGYIASMNQTAFKLVLALLLLLKASLGAASITVTPASNTINQAVVYTFILDLGSNSIRPGLTTLVFNATGYSFSNTTAIQGCYNAISTSVTYSCYASSSTSISFRWTTGMSSPLYLSINTLTNPSYVDTYIVGFAFTPDGGGIFDTQYFSMTSFQPDTLTSCSMSFSPNYTNTLSNITFTFVNKNAIPAGGSLTLNFSGYTPTSSSLAIYSSSASIDTSVVPSFDGTSIFIMSGFFRNPISAGTSISFSIAQIRSPPTISSSLYSITIMTSAKTGFFNKIDQRSCTISNIANFPTASMSVAPASTMLVGNTQVTINVNFIAPTNIDFTTDTIAITVDSSSTTYLSLYYLSIAVTTNVTSGGLPGSNFSTGVTFPTSSTSLSIASGTAVQIRSGLFSSATVTSGTRTLAMQFYRSGNSYSYNTASFTVSPNTLQAASLSVLSSTVSAFTTYTFNLQINNGLGVGAGVRITLPSSIEIATGACTVSVSLSVVNAVSSVILCSASSAQSIFVSNITSALISSGTTMSLSVQNIRNPTTTKTTSSLVYQTYYSLFETANVVDDSSGYSITFTASPVTIPDANFVVAGRTSTTNLQFASYTFTYKVYTTFPPNGIITLILPNNMILSTSATANYVLSTGPTNVSVPVTSSSSLSSTTVTLNFNGLVTSTLPKDTVFTITVSNIRNYYSYKPVSIQLISYTSDSFAVEQSNSAAVAIANTSPDTSLTAAVSTSNTVNGAPTSYTLTLTSPVDLTSADLISIELAITNNVNTQLAYSTSVTCSVNSVATNCTKDTTNSRLLLLTTGSAITASTASTVTISNVVPARSLEQPGNILLKTYQSSSGVYLISTYTLTPPANSLTNLITAASLSISDGGISSARLNVPTTFTLSVSPTNTLIVGDFIVVTVPSEWTNIQSSYVVVSNASTISTLTGSLCSGATVFCSNYLGDPYKIRVDDKTGTAFPGVTNISFTITSSVYVSPKDWASSYSTFSFVTYNNNSYGIDASNSSTVNSAQFTLACPNSTSFHCKTCNSSGICTACYQVGDGYDTTWNYGGYFVRQSTGECVSSCGANYYNNSNFCDQCTAPCFGCTSGSTSTCTSCIAPTVLTNSSCLASCETGFYNNSGVCAACSSPCATCQSSSSTCLSCNNGTYLNGNTCGNNCNGVTGTYADSTTWTCAACITNCSSCSGTASNCTTCASTYFLTGTNVCTQNCPTGQAKLNDTTCTCNYTACLTCALTINTCTSCDSGLVLKNNACTTSCGDNYYLSGSTCVACVSNCQTCTSSGCTVCNSTASILYNGSCYSSCPSGTSASGSSCITCSTGCSSCSASTFCTQCQSIFYLVIYVNGTAECVRPCPTDYPYLDDNICVSSCSSGKSPDSSNTCTSSSSSNSGSTTTTLTSSSRIVPFPVTIFLAVFSVACLASKVALPYTVLAACLCAFAGLAEAVSWLVFVVAAAVSADSDANLTKSGMAIVLVAFLLNLVLNIVAMLFFRKYIWVDEKFQLQLKKLRMKTKCGVSLTYTTLIMAIVFSHKMLEILFSNLFQAQFLIYKVTQVNKFTPLNYVRYFSIIITILAVGGAAVANYEVQNLQMSSITFIQSIDLIIVTLLAAIVGIWATIRNPDQYETTLAEKRNDIEEELEHDPIEDDINQFESEVNKGLKKKYTFSSSIRNTDPREDPLKQKMMAGKNPIGEEYNITNMPLDNHDDEGNRIDLNQTEGGPSYNAKRRITDGLAIEDIGFNEESGDSLLPNKLSKSPKGKGDQKRRLKDSIEKKLNQQERAKTKVIREVDTIHTSVLVSEEEAAQQASEDNLKELSKNEAKVQRLEVLDGAAAEDLTKLPEEERGKAGEIKDAMTILKAKKVSIGDYLDYLDIIEEENEDGKSSDYDFKKDQAKKKHAAGNMSKSSKKKGTNHKSIRKDRSARYQADDKLFVNSIDSDRGPGAFEDDAQPQPANFHNRPRNQSHDYSPNDIEELTFSGLRSSTHNRSEQIFKKQKGNPIDMVVMSLESGDNDDPSLGEQFQRGSTLKQTDKDELPPSNLYATQKVVDKNRNKASLNSFPKNKMGKNRLIGEDDHIEYIESEGGENETVANELLDYNNDISPSQFDEPNLRIQNDEASNAPTRPKIPQKPNNLKRDNNDEVWEIEDLQEVDDYDEFQRGYEENKKGGMQRYQSDRNLDYDDILYQKRKNEKMKQLQQIYLPRQEVPRAYKPKRRLNQSTNTHRESK